LGAAAGIWRVRRAGANAGAFADAVAPALLVAQAVGRVGNYFNKELFGGPTSLPWGLYIPPGSRPPRYLGYTTFHPPFLYELIFDLLLAAGLVWLGHHRAIKVPGLFALYVMGYSAFRIFEESLRVDPSEHFLGLRLNMYVAIAGTVAGGAWFWYTQRYGKGRPGNTPGLAAARAAGGGTAAGGGGGGGGAGAGGAGRAPGRGGAGGWGRGRHGGVRGRDRSGRRTARRGGRGRGRGPLRGAPARLVITTAITRERSVPWRVPGRGRSVAAQSRATSAGPRPRR